MERVAEREAKKFESEIELEISKEKLNCIEINRMRTLKTYF